MKITKFGGSSVADATQFKKVKEIIQADKQRRFVVVSAPGKKGQLDSKITDLLYLLDAHRTYHVDASNVIKLIHQRFQDIIIGLKLSQNVLDEVDDFLNHYDQLSQAAIASRGEYFCAKLMAEYLGFPFVDALDVIFFRYDKTVDLEKTKQALASVLTKTDRFVFPGFYGTSPTGEILTFPRGGGDITGAILARCLDADVYENWTDVSGFLMADPRIVSEAEQITHITYSELRELSYMGASVLHEEAIFPAKEVNIPIHILNTNRPQDKGTIIQEHLDFPSPYPITGIAGKKGFTSIMVHKKHMTNHIGFLRRALSILESYNISVEHVPTSIDSFSIVVDSAKVEHCLYEMLATMKKELKPDRLELKDHIALISTVGRSMSNNPGTSGRLFGALGHINIVMIAQGSDELNITVGVSEEDFDETIQTIYHTFVKGA